MGGTVQVPTLSGDVVIKVCSDLFTFIVSSHFMLILRGEIIIGLTILSQVKPGTQPGQKVVLRGKGNLLCRLFILFSQCIVSLVTIGAQ